MATAKKVAPAAKTAAPVKSVPTKAAAPAKKVVKSAEPESVEEAEDEAEAPAVPRSRGPRGTTEDAVIHLLVEGNPKRDGSKAAQVFAHYVDGMTIGEFADALASSDLGKEATPNLVYDSKHGFISIDGYEPPGGVLEPKAPKEPKPKAEPKGKAKSAKAQAAEADLAAREVEDGAEEEAVE